MHLMAHRSNARLLAPLALIGSVLAVGIVAGTSLGGADSPPAGTTSGDTAKGPAIKTRGAANKRAQTTIVKPGDTPSAIAQREGISLDRLLELNPRIVDPRTLHAGDRLKLGP